LDFHGDDSARRRFLANRAAFTDSQQLSILAATDTSRRILNGTLDLVIIFSGPFLVSLFTETPYLFTNCSLRANQIYFTVLPPISIMARKVLSFSLVRTRPAHSY
jgi:hypothetical protein